MTLRLPGSTRAVSVPWRGLLRGMAVALMLAGPAAAETALSCAGRDLMPTLTADDRAALAGAVARVPHARGILWRADKATASGPARITLVGTYHFADPRHRAILERLRANLEGADVLLVEAGPDEERQLTEALARDPTLMADPTGPTLPERLGPADWGRLSAAMAARGVPAVIASRLRPWYVATMLGLSPCMIRQARDADDAGGLDHLMIRAAQAADVPVRALEPWDTLFGLFRDMTADEEEDMIRAALPAAAHADDYAATATEAYFRGDVWAIWEFGRLDAYRSSGLSRAEVDAQMALAKAQLMEGRNRLWIAPLTRAALEAAGRGRGVVAAFGALHLPGDAGVLRLLEDAGWTVTPLAP